MSAAAPVVVTGAAGFIGHAVSERLLARGESVVGVDDFNAYYEVSLKEARAARLLALPGFELARMDIADADAFSALVRNSGAMRIVHLAAQAGVRQHDPQAYARSNLVGHLSVLEACRRTEGFAHLVYASSASVYCERSGATAFAETDALGPPTTLYAATKQADELLSQTYASQFGLPQTGLRFFTVYGPWGRPDMAYFAFARAILAGEPITLFADGELRRDFTYIDDIVTGVLAVLDRPPDAPRHRRLNIGAGHPERVATLVQTLERLLGVRARTVAAPKPVSEMSTTFADVSQLEALTGYAPQVRLEEGLTRFVEWYRAYQASGGGG